MIDMGFNQKLMYICGSFDIPFVFTAHSFK